MGFERSADYLGDFAAVEIYAGSEAGHCVLMLYWIEELFCRKLSR